MSIRTIMPLKHRFTIPPLFSFLGFYHRTLDIFLLSYSRKKTRHKRLSVLAAGKVNRIGKGESKETNKKIQGNKARPQI